jgi:hypothetical protein
MTMSEPGRRRAAAPATARPRGLGDVPMARAMGWLFVFALAVYALSGGGRVVGSDEVTMLELSRAMLRGGVAVPEGATLTGPGGLHYTKNTAAQAVIALPVVAAAEGAAALFGLDEGRRRLAVRFVASFFNAVVTAALLVVFYLVARMLGVGPGAALVATFALGFTTPLWPYAKSFMAEPLQALGLLLALMGATAASRLPKGESIAAMGVLLAVSAKLSMLPLALACLAPMAGVPRRRWLVPLQGLLIALAGHALYNWVRFGTPLETGYGAQASGSAFTTPLAVGLYGLLVSSGKGVLWFAPLLWLAPAGWRAMREGAGLVAAAPQSAWESRGAGRAASWGILAAWGVGLLLYARFQHWAGDGSFGPRYLIPLLPPAFLAVAFALERVSRARRILAGVLIACGLIVQIGGVSIYFGAQMREAGDYPYTLPLEHPRFMSDSHFNPAFNPITDHWRMLIRNAGEHFAGQAPRLELVNGAGTRVGVGEADQARLLHALDFWWLYLTYAGLPAAPVAAAALLLAALAAFAMWRLRAAWRDEIRGP